MSDGDCVRRGWYFEENLEFVDWGYWEFVKCRIKIFK